MKDRYVEDEELRRGENRGNSAKGEEGKRYAE